MRGDTTRCARLHGSASPMTGGLMGTSGSAAIPTTALDLPLVQRLRCVSAWKKDPRGGVIGVQKGPLC
jgi:hypothetical protein